MAERTRFGAVILGSGNIGTDLMMKIHRTSPSLKNVAMAGIDPDSEGLARAARLGIATTANGIDGLTSLVSFGEAHVIFDATSAHAHQHHARFAREHNKLMIDLTPAAIGAYVVPVVNLPCHFNDDNINMVTCGGQATIPIVAAVSDVAPVAYAEIVASIASRSAGPGTRANIDEFTETTSRAIESVGRAQHGKAIIILNPADPPIIMRDTVYCLVEQTPESQEGNRLHQAITDSVQAMEARVRQYVPGYRVKQNVQFDAVAGKYVPALGRAFSGTKVTVLLEVTGAGHYLPKYAGNLDIMTSAALHTAEAALQRRETAVP